MLRVVVCVSGGGTNLQAIIDAVADGTITNTELVGVISNNYGVRALERAEKAGIDAKVVSPKDYENRAAFNEGLLTTIRAYKPDLIVLAGFLVVIPEAMIEEYENRIINIHPSLIPSFCGTGYYGLKVHEAALARGVKLTGATVHYVDKGTDTGPILLTDLDFIFAKAKFARATNSTRPIFNTDGIIDIRQGRHPLLEKHTVVPVDIRLGETYNLLIITGPNTGGKTVSLKTLGLFSLMGQAGLHIPAMEESRLAVFDDIFADIGDEQSIEQNLSTFSSHMSNIVYIVQHATPNTLCLFDEPGGGTDPVEGAALAVSILNYLKSMGARCMATTHYSELKTYALSTDGVENASCEFDVATLRPTYRLTIGIPGKSNAFAIASKLGLPDYIINSAKDQIDSDAIDMETLLADLEASKRSMQEDEKAIEAYKQEIESLKESLQKKEENLDTKKAEILKKAREEARDIIEDAKDVADQTIRDYNKWRNNPHKADMRTMEEQRSKLRSKIKDYEKSGASETKKQTSNHKASDFHIGDTVQVLSMGTRGTITKLPDNKGIAGVQMGILNSMLPISDLLIIPESTVSVNGTKQKYSGKRAGGDHTSVSKSMTFSPELNVMGKTVDEACFEIDKYLDDAVLAHISRDTIIHGKGTGALRKGIWQYLKKHPLVQSYRAGEFGEGEYGVTIVEL